MINWGLLGTPPGWDFGPINQTLGQMADDRQKREYNAYLQAQMAQQERIRADDRALREQQMTQAGEIARQKAERDKRKEARAADAAAAPGLAEARKAARQGNWSGAAAAITPFGGTLAPIPYAPQVRQVEDRPEAANETDPAMRYFLAMQEEDAAAQGASDQWKANPRLQYTLPSGTTGVIAPMEEDRAEREAAERIARETSAMFSQGPLAQLPHASRAATVAGAYGAAGAKREDAVKSGLASAQFAEGQDQAASRARIAGSNAVGRAQDRVVDNERQDATAFSNIHNQWAKTQNVDVLIDAVDTTRKLTDSVESYRRNGDVISQRDALYSIARAITGPGVLTAQEYQNTSVGTAGLLGSFMSKMQKGLTGEISAQEQAAVEKFVSNAQRTMRAKAVKAVRNFDTRFGNTRWMRNVPEEVQSQRASMMDRLGVTEADLTAKPASRPRPVAARPGAPTAPQAQPPAAPAAKPQQPVRWLTDDDVDSLYNQLPGGRR